MMKVPCKVMGVSKHIFSILTEVVNDKLVVVLDRYYNLVKPFESAIKFIEKVIEQMVQGGESYGLAF